MSKKLTPDVPGQIAFNPRPVGDITPALREQHQRDQAAAARFNRSQNQNYETLLGNNKLEQQAAKQYGEDVAKLSKFSQTLMNQIIEQKKQQNATEQEEGIALAYEQGIDIDTSNAFEEAEAEVTAADSVTQQAAGAAFQQTNSYETASRVKGLSGWKAYGYSLGRAQMAGSTYGPWMKEQLNTDNTTKVTVNGREFTPATAKGADEVAAAMAVLRRKFIAKMGLGGASAAVLNKYAFPQMHRYDSQIMFEKRNQFDKETAFEETNNAFRDFQSTKDLNTLFSQLRVIRGKDGELP